MSWPKERIGNHCEITSSKRIFFSEYVERGIPFYRSKEIIEKSQGIEITEPLFISQQKYDEIRDRYGVPAIGDLLLTSVGTIGIPYIIKPHDEFYFKDGNLTWFRNFDSQLLSQFLGYWIESAEGHGVLNNSTIGSSQKALTISALCEIECPLPPIYIQKRIVDILSAYDSLIETNQRQIKLLEEAAQRLYKEWFVDLRYPGHENVPVVDGVPNGWKKTVFSERVDVLSGGTPKTSNPEYYNGTIPFYSPKDSDDRFYAFDTETHISESGLENCNSKLYPEGTIIITARGTVGKTTILAKPMAMNQSCYALRSSQVSSVFFLFFALRQEILALKAMANGGVFDTIIVKTFDRINLTTPSAPVIQAFDKLVTPIMGKMKSLLIENRNLSEARDRLLPKLMSGEITV